MVGGGERVYAIHYRVNSVWFLIGYCEHCVIKARRIELDRPFTRRVIHTLGGELFFRGPWPRPLTVPVSTYALDPIAREIWMLLTYEDITESQRVLSESIPSFHPGGFNRLGDR